MEANRVLVEVERFGFSDDPVYDVLINKLGMLAGEWRATKSDEVVQQYDTVLRTLLMLGWRDPLDVDVELPERLMPQAYLQLFEE